MTVPLNHLFVRDDILPSWWANSIQRMLTAKPPALRHASTTTVGIGASADEPVGLPIQGRWRWIETSLVQAAGGAAGSYDVFLTAADNDIQSTPAPFTDDTDYAFSCSILPTGTTPTIVSGTLDIFRKIGSLYWDGTVITRISQTVGDRPTHTPGVVEFHAGPIDATHPLPVGRQLADGGLVNIADCPGLFGAIGHTANGGVDPGGGKMRKPDGRGRVLVGAGVHTEISTPGATENGYEAKAADEANLATRRVWHTHTVASHTHALPSHVHTVPAHFHGKGNLGITDPGHLHSSVGAHDIAGGFGTPAYSSTSANATQTNTAVTGATLSGTFVGNNAGSNGDSAFNSGAPTSLPASGAATPATDEQGPAFLVGNWVVCV